MQREQEQTIPNDKGSFAGKVAFVTGAANGIGRAAALAFAREGASMPAADVEGTVLDHLQKLLAAPELVARTWATAKRESQDEITEREVTALLAEFATAWNELFPAEQARIVQLLVERVDVHEDALEVRIRAQGLASLVCELQQQDERKAA